MATRSLSRRLKPHRGLHHDQFLLGSKTKGPMSFVFQRNGTLWRAATTPPLAIRSPGVHRSLATLVRSAVRPLRTAQAVHCASPCSNFKRNLSITPRRVYNAAILLVRYLFKLYEGWASAASPQTSSDPAEVEALQCLEEGTQKLEDVSADAIFLLIRSRELTGMW